MPMNTGHKASTMRECMATAYKCSSTVRQENVDVDAAVELAEFDGVGQWIRFIRQQCTKTRASVTPLCNS